MERLIVGKIIAFIALLIISFSCQQENASPKYPDCFQGAIKLALNASPTTPRASIKKYNVSSDYYSGIVYEVNVLNVPDGGGTYQTSDCKIICGFGGLAGATTCDAEFINKLEFLETVWEDPR